MAPPPVRFSVYIPARFASTRLPGKLLLTIEGRPIIEWTCRQALASSASKVVVATDDERIAAAVKHLGVQVRMVTGQHPSGTDRIAEATASNSEPDDALIVNVQGDEPFLPPLVINQVAGALEQDSRAVMASVCEPFATAAEVLDPHTVKVVRDGQQRALYFSRAPIPWERNWDQDRPDPELIRDRLGDYRRHVGLYACRAGYLRQFVRYAPPPLERIECLEQLRVLYYGGMMVVPDAVAVAGVGIDTAADLERARRRNSAGVTVPGK